MKSGWFRSSREPHPTSKQRGSSSPRPVYSFAGPCSKDGRRIQGIQKMIQSTLVCVLAAIGSCALDAQTSCQALASQTVRIQRGTSQGAGVVLRSDGQTAWITTAKHVIDGQGNIL